MRRKRVNTVYSTDPDFVRERPKPKEAKSLPPSEQVAHIRREKKGRGGKNRDCYL